jgi:hypothetical protein
MRQTQIGDDDLDNMEIHRQQLSTTTTWPDVIKPPYTPGGNHYLFLPFVETFENAFSSMYTREYRANHAAGGRLQLWLNDSAGSEEAPEEAQKWVELIGKYVAIQDCLAISFAIDFTCKGGNPNEPKTPIGKLVRTAKPYGNEAVSNEHHKAAKKLAEKCIAVLNELTCYNVVDCVVAVPPSDPEKAYSLPKVLSAAIAKARGIKDLSVFVSTKANRASIKDIETAVKLPTLRGTIELEQDKFSGRTVLLIDDLYQSGTTMNYCAKLIHDAGAKYVLGLACVKTCSNDDNF